MDEMCLSREWVDISSEKMYILTGEMYYSYLAAAS